jgi:hypothetical protein
MHDVLQQLVDERDVVGTCVRYATALDGRDWPLLGTCFTPDAIAEYGDREACHGYPAIEDLCREALTPLSGSHHLLGNHVAVVEGDGASASCYFQAQHVRDGSNFIIAGRYVDRFARTGDGWRIAHRRLEIWWTDGDPDVIAR